MPSYAEGDTNIIVPVLIQDDRRTDGRGLAGLSYTSVGLMAYYQRNNAGSSVAITLANMTAGTWVSGGFKEQDPTHMRGWYHFGLPDALFAATYLGASVHLQGADHMVDVPLRCELAASSSSPFILV